MRLQPLWLNRLFAVLLIPVALLHGQSSSIGLSAMSNGFSTTPAQSGRMLISSIGQNVVRTSSGSLRRVESGFLPAIQSLSGQPTTTNLGIQAGWNLISVPRTVNDYGKNTLFPTSTSQAFAYQAGYVSQPVLANGIGYWLKFGSSQNVSISGFPRGVDSVTVLAGWNLIGSISTSLPVANVGSNPGGIVTSQFFGYNAGGYAVASTVDPGKGYWVKVSQNGTLILSASSPPHALIRIVSTSELPPAPPGNETAGTTEIPTEFSLGQNYPNPFNPSSNFEFRISKFTHVQLAVYDLLGRHVATLVDETKQPGTYTVTFSAKGGSASGGNAANLASGTYIYRLTAGSFTAVKKMILLR